MDKREHVHQVKDFPHVQVVGMLDGSQHAPLCKVRPFSSIGRVVNQLDDPFT